ncbi:MAG: alpha-glucosidase [Fusobacteriaceae bacterium]|jgi:alpha-glucosidase|nr:alpha-glucosidase [Fusobacteriaceae bacterium]
MNWKKSLHSEVNKIYVSNPYPKLGETISIKISMLSNNDVKRIFLRTPVNGEVEFYEMLKLETINNIDYYSTEVKISKKFFHYHFIIELEDEFLYFTRNSLTAYIPTEDYDFVILADFKNPDWVPKSVFYQIFPDRFNKGDKNLGVKTNEYIFDGHQPIEMNWEDKPLEYKDGHCLDFYNGDLKGIQDKIDYFKELGVNALYLNPILSAKTTHRYDCTDYFNVDEHLGGNSALESLTKNLHENNMKIMLDVSINHTGMEHIWFKKALADKNSKERSYYYINDDNSYFSWLGFHTLPQLNFNSQELRNILYRDENSFVKKFLKQPYNIDGWRFDVGNHTGRKELEDHCHSIWKEVRNSIKETKSNAYYIGEHWEDNISHLLGDEWDSSMNYFSCSKPIRRFMGCLDRRFWHIKDKKKRVKPSTGYELATQITQHLNRLPNQIAFLQFNLIDSHDIYRLHNFKDGFNFELYKGLVSLMYLLPGTPSIYYGDEIGIDGHLDSDEGIRYPMVWDRDKWDFKYFNLYKTLSHLKQKETTLHYGNYKVLYADDDTFSFARFDNKKIIFNLVSRNSSKSIKLDLSIFGINSNISKEIFSNKTFNINNGILEIPLTTINNGVFIIEI